MRKLIVLLAAVFFICACAPSGPVPQPRRVVDPGDIPGAVHAPDWDIAAVGYAYSGKGVNYRKAGLEPVFLVFRNKSGEQPRLARDDVHGIGNKGTFLPYSPQETERLVFASETFKETTKNALKSGGFGAFIGAGLGAILGSISGGDAIASGAAIGAGAGGLAAGAATVPRSEDKVRDVIRRDIHSHAWKENPIPEQKTRMGYVYLPAEKGIDRVSLRVRTDHRVEKYTIPVTAPRTVNATRE